MLQPGDQAPDVSFGRVNGGIVALEGFWRERTVVVAFLRHFG